MKWLVKSAMPVLDIALVPVVLIEAVVIKLVRQTGFWRMHSARKR